MSEAASHTDLQLFALIAEGDETAFEKLFYHYVPKIRPVVLSIIKSGPFVDDIIQEVFFELWLGREKLADVASPRNWIFKIAYNISYGWLEKQLVRQRAGEKLQNQRMQSSEGHNTTEATVYFNEATRLLSQAIHQLPPQAKRIYLLRRQGGIQIVEIAEQLDISPQSVKNSLYRSTIAIREYLIHHGLIVPAFLLVFGLQ